MYTNNYYQTYAQPTAPTYQQQETLSPAAIASWREHLKAPCMIDTCCFMTGSPDFIHKLFGNVEKILKEYKTCIHAVGETHLELQRLSVAGKNAETIEKANAGLYWYEQLQNAGLLKELQPFVDMHRSCINTYADPSILMWLMTSMAIGDEQNPPLTLISRDSKLVQDALKLRTMLCYTEPSFRKENQKLISIRYMNNQGELVLSHYETGTQQPQTSSYEQHPQHYGYQPQIPSYGQPAQPQASTYRQQSQTPAYGQQPQPQRYGQQPQTPIYGQQQPQRYGQPAPQRTPAQQRFGPGAVGND